MEKNLQVIVIEKIGLIKMKKKNLFFFILVLSIGLLASIPVFRAIKTSTIQFRKYVFSLYLVKKRHLYYYKILTLSITSRYELDYIRNNNRLKRGEKVWQLAFGSGFKCNSAVWEVLKTLKPSRDGMTSFKQSFVAQIQESQIAS